MKSRRYISLLDLYLFYMKNEILNAVNETFCCHLEKLREINIMFSRLLHY